MKTLVSEVKHIGVIGFLSLMKLCIMRSEALELSMCVAAKKGKQDKQNDGFSFQTTKFHSEADGWQRLHNGQSMV